MKLVFWTTAAAISVINFTRFARAQTTPAPTAAPTTSPTSYQNYYLADNYGAAKSPPQCGFDNTPIPQWRGTEVPATYQDYVFNGRTCEASELAAYENMTFSVYPECAIQFINYEGLPLTATGDASYFNMMNGCSSGWAALPNERTELVADDYTSWWDCMHRSIEMSVSGEMHVGSFHLQLYNGYYKCRMSACHGPGISDGVGELPTFAVSPKSKNRFAWFKNMTACVEAVQFVMSGQTHAPTPEPTVATAEPTTPPAPTPAPTSDPARLVTKKVGAKVKTKKRQNTIDALNTTLASLSNETEVTDYQIILNYTEAIVLNKVISTRSATNLDDSEMEALIKSYRLGAAAGSALTAKVTALSTWYNGTSGIPEEHFYSNEDDYANATAAPTASPIDQSFRRALADDSDTVTFRIEFTVTADAFAEIASSEDELMAGLSELLGYNVTIDAFNETEVDVDILFPANATADEIEEVSSELDSILAQIRAALSLEDDEVESTDVELCLNRDCSDRGTCNESTGNCDCDDNWLGANCERECVCNNDGWCANKWCRCKFPYFGETCDELIDCGTC